MGFCTNFPPLRLVLIASITSFGTSWHSGFHLIVFNPTQFVFKDFINASYITENNTAGIDEHAYSLIWSSVLNVKPLGQLIAIFAVPSIANKLGRKRGMMIGVSLLLVGAVPSIAAKPLHSWHMLFLGELIGGIALGIAASMNIMTMCELATVASRGFINSMDSFFVEIGVFMGAIIGLPELLGTDTKWPWIFVIELAPTILLLCYLPWLPQSPKYLASQGEWKEAERIMTRFVKDDDELEINLNDVRKELDLQKTMPTFREFLQKKEIRNGVLVGVIACALQPMTGVMTIDFFATMLMLDTGFEFKHALYSNIGITAGTMIFGFIAVLLIDKVGRRPLFMLGNSLVILMDILFMVILVYRSFMADPTSQWPGTVYSIGAHIFMMAYALGPGAIASFLITEMVPINCRAHALSLGSVVGSGARFLAGAIFLPIYEIIGGWAFLFYIVPQLVGMAYLWRKMPETSNRQISGIIDECQDRVKLLPNDSCTIPYGALDETD